ncbi:MAG: nuclear transport factor 2 family protein [Bryobacterales bacterium]|nr:nuclear transport factor 2 family protein [Bryobacterales bacterium]
MTTKSFEAWLELYLRRQEQRDPEVIKELFAEDCVYWWGPFHEARYGLEATYNHHKNALSHQDNIKYEYEVLATTAEYGIARFHLTLHDQVPGEPDTYDGIFLVHLNGENKCTLFEEWYHSTWRGRSEGA